MIAETISTTAPRRRRIAREPKRGPPGVKTRRARAVIRAGGGRVAVDLDLVVIVRRRGDVTNVVHAPRVVDGAAVVAVENFLTANAADSDNILHDVELAFPDLRFRDFFVAYSRWRDAEAMLRGS